MAIFLPERTTTSVGSLTPREIVAELDNTSRSAKAKRAVAIALLIGFAGSGWHADMAEEVRRRTF